METILRPSNFFLQNQNSISQENDKPKSSTMANNSSKLFQPIPIANLRPFADTEEAPFKFFNNLPRAEKLKLINFEHDDPNMIIVHGNAFCELISGRVFAA